MYLIQTVQTSWRPQVPPPKEIPTQPVQNSSSSMDTKQTKKETPTNKKWSFGRFFRKKKELDSDSSSEEDRKAGFIALQKSRKKEKRKRNSKTISPGFDHIVINPKNGETNELFLPFEAIDTTESIRSSGGSADRRGRREKRHRLSKQQIPHNSSSEDDLHSHNSSSLLRYRSDESLGSAGVPGNRRSRAARTERYYKRISRDENTPMVTQQIGRWKTQPVQPNAYDYNPPSQEYYLKTSTSVSNVPNVQSYIYAVPNKPNRMNPVNSDKRSISYENHIHLQNMYDRRDGSIRSMPPPPPPRDPLRRVHLPGQNEIRPISYAFDKSASQSRPINNRCVSDDKLWGPEGSIYQSSLHRPSSVQPTSQPRRFITRADRDMNQSTKGTNGQLGVDYRYIADAIPRSRKPIHILQSEESKLEASPNTVLNATPPIIRTTKSGLPSPSPVQAATNFWKQIDQQEVQRRERVTDVQRRLTNGSEKPRSFSSSRASVGPVLRNGAQHGMTYFQGKMNKSLDEIDNVVSGNLYLKPTKDKENNFMKVSTKSNENKSRSMPNYYQQQRQVSQQLQEQQLQRRKTSTPPSSKYDENIARRAPEKVIKPVKVPPPPPQRKSIKISTEDLRKPNANLEEAINELEAIYKSLKLGDEELMDRAERRDIPTPTNFEKYAVVSDEDEEINDAEPDVVLDDVAYRNIQRANSMIKTIEPQPPFGIPILPIPPSPNTDYLHVVPDKEQKKNRCVPQNIPDLVTDDLAVRALRKDVPGLVKPTAAYPLNGQKKKRAIRSMSANIYNLIQRDAAKPSGGSLFDYGEMDRALEKAGSLTDVRRQVDDVPSTLQLLKNLRKQETELSRKPSPPIFRHPSLGGAVFNLPSTLNSSPQDSPHILQKPPIPLPRKSHSPEPMQDTKVIEEALNRIAKEAKESSEKLSKELKELRSEKLSVLAKPISIESLKSDKESEDVWNRIKPSEMSNDTVAICESEKPPTPKPRRVSRDEKVLDNTEEMTKAAKLCERILKNAVKIEPPVIVEKAGKVSQAVTEIHDFISKKVEENRSVVPRMEDRSLQSEPDLIEFSDGTESPRQPLQPLAVTMVLKCLNPIKSQQIGAISERCMRQISELGNAYPQTAVTANTTYKVDDEGDYDNLNSEPEVSNSLTCKQEIDDGLDDASILRQNAIATEISQDSEAMAPLATQDDDEEDIDKIMKECEDQVTSKTPYASLSSSDCPKSSSPASSRHKSSSITSIHAMSSSDYVKSSSSEFQTPSTDPIKTFSTTSYDVNSSSPTPNITNSPMSTTPSPLLALTPASRNVVGEVDESQVRPESLYNSSEELAMIFGMASPVQVSTSLLSENASTITSITTTATTGKKKLALRLTKNANACVAIANNNQKSVAITSTPATNSTTIVTTIVVAASTSPTSSISTTTSCTSPTSETDADCLAVAKSTCQQQDQSETMEHDSECASFVTIASFRTPETCRLIRLAPSPVPSFTNITCLDTIPELHDHDDDNDDDESDVDDRFVVDNKNTFDTFNRFHNTNEMNMIHNIFARDIDETSKLSVSSNPDSGNVSLSDFPLQESPTLGFVDDVSMNASLELSLLQNSQLACSEWYPYVNQVEIQTVGENHFVEQLCLREERILDCSETVTEFDRDQNDDTGFIDKNLSDVDSSSTDSRSDSPTFVAPSHVEPELRDRSVLPLNTSRALEQSSRLPRSCRLSQSDVDDFPSTSKKAVSNFLTPTPNRQGFLQHIIIACTCGVASQDFYTLVAIAFAMILMIALLLI